ncbi:MAG TPA: dihydrofolate reductase family protein [Cytophagaceae bacterium]|jgi:dihydrofolate reductase|nr:dihydrofolate reductase family protein [Cytophagaceae bacterium]
MRKLVVRMTVTADGYMCGPNKEMDWLFRNFHPDTKDWVVETISGAGLHIMGSKTFNDMKSYWPAATEVLAEPMNKIPKAVFSRKGIAKGSEGLTTQARKDTPTSSLNQTKEQTEINLKEWESSPVLTGPIYDELLRLKQQPGNFILAHGGVSFIQSVVATGLVDEYRLIVCPVVIGKGLSMFSSLEKAVDLKLINSIAFHTGIVGNVYRPK